MPGKVSAGGMSAAAMVPGAACGFIGVCDQLTNPGSCRLGWRGKADLGLGQRINISQFTGIAGLARADPAQARVIQVVLVSCHIA